MEDTAMTFTQDMSTQKKTLMVLPQFQILLTIKLKPYITQSDLQLRNY